MDREKAFGRGRGRAFRHDTQGSQPIEQRQRAARAFEVQPDLAALQEKLGRVGELCRIPKRPHCDSMTLYNLR